MRFSLFIDVLCKAKSCCYYNVILALQMLIFKRFGLQIRNDKVLASWLFSNSACPELAYSSDAFSAVLPPANTDLPLRSRNMLPL